MDTLAFDGRTGASGDMILGALLDLGADRACLSPVVETLEIEYGVSRVTRHNISATHVTVTRDGDPVEATDHPRRYQEVIDTVEAMELPPAVHADTTAIFRLLAEAEATIHDSTIDEVHFHEVGADDAIADIVGSALLLDDIDPAQVLTTPVATGSGTVSLTHGTYPVPPPAVVALAESASWDIRGGPTDHELLTPTGAAILAHYATGVPSLPTINVSDSGYGAGTRDLTEHANVLRAITGRTATLRHDDITVLETNVDDVSPEVLGGLQDALTDAGARDISIVPLTMKKSRPGHLVQVIAKPEDAHGIAHRLAEETGTLGIRQTPATHRLIAQRDYTTTTLRIDGTEYEVTVKLAQDTAGTIYDISAEYEDALAVARETGRPIREIMRLAETTARESIDTEA